MYAIDFIADFSVDPIAEPDTTLAQLLQQTEKHNTTLTLTTSKRGLMNQVPKEAIAETLDFEFCSSSSTAGKIRRVIDLLGPERIFFGTDQPLFAPWFEYGAYLDAFQNEREAALFTPLQPTPQMRPRQSLPSQSHNGGRVLPPCPTGQSHRRPGGSSGCRARCPARRANGRPHPAR